MIQKRSALTQHQLQRLVKPYYKYGITKQAILQDMSKQFIKDPKRIRNTWLGKLMFNLAQMLPSSYDTSKYKPQKAKDSQQPVRFVFSGFRDSQSTQYARKHFTKHFGDGAPVYTFGWSQLPQALALMKKIGKDKPYIVYGFSWGSQAAQRFINDSGANVIGAHFLDPMRKDVGRHHQLRNKRNIPMSYTPAQPYPQNDFRRNILQTLRYSPAAQSRILNPVSSHGAFSQWLQQIDAEDQQDPIILQKAASYKYGPL